MRSIKKLSKIFLITLVIIIGSINFCFADVVVSPLETRIVESYFLGILAIGVMFTLNIISLLCMLVAKICKNEKMYNKSKSICDKLVFYMLYILVIVNGYFCVIHALLMQSIIASIICIALYILGISSIYFRLKLKDKRRAYKMLLVSVVVFGVYNNILMY